jgi:hypothetical protein
MPRSLQVKGHVLLVRMNEDSVPEDFTLKEFKAYCANPPPPVDTEDEEVRWGEGPRSRRFHPKGWW